MIKIIFQFAFFKLRTTVYLACMYLSVAGRKLMSVKVLTEDGLTFISVELISCSSLDMTSMMTSSKLFSVFDQSTSSVLAVVQTSAGQTASREIGANSRGL